MTALEIRQARIEDLPAAVALVRLATAKMERQGVDQWDEIYPSGARLRDDIDRGQMYLLAMDGITAGIVTLNEHQSPEYEEVAWRFGGSALVVHRMAVHPDYQGQKVASRLLGFAEELAGGRYDTIRLDAFQRNPAAVALYERRGYRKAGTVTFRKGPFYCFEKRIPRPGGDSPDIHPTIG